MIEAITSALLTPATLATVPPNVPAIERTYDWNSQVQHAPLKARVMVGPGLTFIPAHCFINGNLVTDGISGTD